MITDPNVVGYRGECSCPPGAPVVWTVTRRDHAGTVLGTVTEKLWIDARDTAIAKWSGERDSVTVELAKESGQ